jgi:hypothetical protein
MRLETTTARRLRIDVSAFSTPRNRTVGPPCTPTGGADSCCLGVHCYDVFDPTGSVRIGRHCGITVYHSDGDVVWIDAHPTLHPLSPDPDNCIKISTGVNPLSRRGTTETKPIQATPAQCNCAYNYMSKFAIAGCHKYQVHDCNSTWAFNCLVSHCGFAKLGMPPGSPPTPGPTCRYCVLSGVLDNGSECCLQRGIRKCP